LLIMYILYAVHVLHYDRSIFCHHFCIFFHEEYYGFFVPCINFLRLSCAFSTITSSNRIKNYRINDECRYLLRSSKVIPPDVNQEQHSNLIPPSPGQHFPINPRSEHFGFAAQELPKVVGAEIGTSVVSMSR